MKYKIGDRVKIVKSGNIGVVTSIHNEGSLFYVVELYNIMLGSSACVAFKEEQLELVSESISEVKPSNEIYNPLNVQQGGDHYKNRGIQPIEYANANNLNPQKFNIVKYVTRHEDKGGVDDLAKVIHYALLEAYFVYGEDGSTLLKEKVLKLLGENI